MRLGKRNKLLRCKHRDSCNINCSMLAATGHLPTLLQGDPQASGSNQRLNLPNIHVHSLPSNIANVLRSRTIEVNDSYRRLAGLSLYIVIDISIPTNIISFANTNQMRHTKQPHLARNSAGFHKHSIVSTIRQASKQSTSAQSLLTHMVTVSCCRWSDSANFRGS